MHGRQKVKRSEQEELKKQVERNKKVSVYQNAMKIIFDKRSKEELDEEILMVIGQVLASNPDITTLWSIRKETLIKLKSFDETTFKEKLLLKELDFTEFCLKANPKSYGAWHHRYWLMKETNFERVAEELRLCTKYLEYDDRNFHCWDYRRFLLDNSSLITVEQELEFTTEKISSNFSNFSSWHLRSKLLPRLSREYLTDELELIRNAVFTDPKDQSAWLYHTWLLKSQIKHELPSVVYMLRTKSRLVIAFNTRVQDPNVLELKLKIADEEKNVTWENPWCSSRSKLWFTVLKNDSNNFITLTISGNILVNEFSKSSVDVGVGFKHNFPQYFDDDTKPKAPEFEKLLREELSWVMELHELEPDIKWPVLTAITLMRLINFMEFKLQISELLHLLLQLDPKRTNYYNDLRSKFVVEWTLFNNLSDSEEISLKKLNLTALYYPERLCHMKKVDCSENSLKNCASLSALLLCEELDLSNNCINDGVDLVSKIRDLKHLTKLKLKGNKCQPGDFIDQMRDLSYIELLV